MYITCILQNNNSTHRGEKPNPQWFIGKRSSNSRSFGHESIDFTIAFQP